MHIPEVPQAGGFTITSTPRDLKVNQYLELAVQSSPGNPPAAWLWQKKEKILGKELLIRAGGNFVWPPPGLQLESIKNLVFVAGGVGIKLVDIPMGTLKSYETNDNITLVPCYPFFLI